MNSNLSDIWSQAAEKAWQIVLEGVRNLRDSGQTLSDIAKLLSVQSPGQIHGWLKGDRVAPNAPFPNMLRYLATLGHDPRDFVPSVTGEMPESSHDPKATAPAPSCTACKKLMAKEKELQKALKDLDRMRLELAKRDGMVEALERQLNRRESAEQAGRQKTSDERRAAG